MANRQLPTPDVLRQLLRYEPDTGKLFWLPRAKDGPVQSYKAGWDFASWNSAYAGREAFTTPRNGYLSGSLLGRPTDAHRIAWALHYGEWPTSHIDHANGDKSDNRISNLRVASRSQNNQNVRSARNSSSRFKGVTWDASRGKWIAGIKQNFKRHNLGRFATEEEAARAHDAAALQLYGPYAKLNFPTQQPSRVAPLRVGDAA